MSLPIPRPQTRLFPRVRSLRLLACLARLVPVLAGGFSTAQAQPGTVPRIGPPPSWVEPVSWTAPAKLEANPSGQDFLLLDEQAQLLTDEHYYRRTYQIVSDAGRQHGAQVYVNFDPSYQTATIHQLKLVRDGVESDRLDPAKIQVLQQERDLDRQLYNGLRSALIILDDVRVGDVIDVAFTLAGRNPVFDGRFVDTIPLEWGVPVRDLRYRLLVPQDRTIGHRRLPAMAAGVPVDFQSRVRNEAMEFTWRRANVPTVEAEERVPSSHFVFSFLDFSEFASWAAVVEWALPLYADAPAARPLLDAVVTDITQKAATPEQRAVAALAFVQQEIRYLGIEMGPGSHRPSEPEEVLRRRFGDCKDKARLLTAMLRQLGLEAAPALVHSSHREAVRTRLPSPYAFDHVIVALDLDRKRYLLDGTLSYQRGSQLALRHVGNYGPYLRVAAGTTRLESATIGPGDIHQTAVHEVFKIPGFEQPGSLTITTTAQGQAADNFRSYFATRSLEQISREYLDYYTRYYEGITQTKTVEHRDTPETNTFTIIEHYQIKNLFTRETGGSMLRAEFQPALIWDYVRINNLDRRRAPYALNFPTQVKETITVHLPEAWNLKAENETINDAAFMGTFRASSPSPKSVELEYTWSSRQPQVPPERFAEFSGNIERLRKILGYQLSWNPATASGSAGYAPNWAMVILAIGMLAGGTVISWRLIRRTNPHPPAPPLLAPTPANPLHYPRPAGHDGGEGLGGWLVLVAIGLFTRPFKLVYDMSQIHRGYFSQETWRLVTTPGSEHYSEHYAWLIPIELMINLSLICWSVLLIVLFFRRSHLFPRTIQAFLGASILVPIFALWEDGLMADAGSQTRPENYKLLLQTVVGAAIWIPYFQISRRVKRTFIR